MTPRSVPAEMPSGKADIPPRRGAASGFVADIVSATLSWIADWLEAQTDPCTVEWKTLSPPPNNWLWTGPPPPDTYLPGSWWPTDPDGEGRVLLWPSLRSTCTTGSRSPGTSFVSVCSPRPSAGNCLDALGAAAFCELISLSSCWLPFPLPALYPTSEEPPHQGVTSVAPLIPLFLVSFSLLSVPPMRLAHSAGGESSPKNLHGAEGKRPPLLTPSAVFHSLGTHRLRNCVPVHSCNALACSTTPRNLKLCARPFVNATAAVMESVSIICLILWFWTLRRACFIA